MAYKYEVNGQIIEFEREPTERDIDEAAAALGTSKKYSTGQNAAAFAASVGDTVVNFGAGFLDSAARLAAFPYYLYKEIPSTIAAGLADAVPVPVDLSRGYQNIFQRAYARDAADVGSVGKDIIGTYTGVTQVPGYKQAPQRRLGEAVSETLAPVFEGIESVGIPSQGVADILNVVGTKAGISAAKAAKKPVYDAAAATGRGIATAAKETAAVPGSVVRGIRSAGKPTPQSYAEIAPETIAAARSQGKITPFTETILDYQGSAPLPGRVLESAVERSIRGYRDQPALSGILDVGGLLGLGFPLATPARAVGAGMQGILGAKGIRAAAPDQPNFLMIGDELVGAGTNTGRGTEFSGAVKIDPVSGQVSGGPKIQRTTAADLTITDIEQALKDSGIVDPQAQRNTMINTLAKTKQVNAQEQGLSMTLNDAKKEATIEVDLHLAKKKETEAQARQAERDRAAAEKRAAAEARDIAYRASPEYQAEQLRLQQQKERVKQSSATIQSEIDARLAETPENANFVQRYVVPAESSEKVNAFLNNQFKRVIAAGPPGTGKTALATEWLARNTTGRLEFINSETFSKQNADKLKTSLETVEKPLLLVDEADKLTKQQQTILSKLVDELPAARVIYTTNEPNKLGSGILNAAEATIDLNTILTPAQRDLFALNIAKQYEFTVSPKAVLDAAESAGDTFRDVKRAVQNLQPENIKSEPLFVMTDGTAADVSSNLKQLFDEFTRNQTSKNVIVIDKSVYDVDPQFGQKLDPWIAGQENVTPAITTNLASSGTNSPLYRIGVTTRETAQDVSSLKGLIERSNESRTPTKLVIENKLGLLDPAIMSRAIVITADDLNTTAAGPKPVVPPGISQMLTEDDLRVGPKPVPPRGVSQMLTEDDLPASVKGGGNLRNYEHENLLNKLSNKPMPQGDYDNGTTRIWGPKSREVTVYKTGTEELHNPDGPAHILYRKDGTVLGEEWNLNGKTHREDGPALIDYYDDGSPRIEYWFRDGKLYREDGPAVIEYDKDGKVINKQIKTDVRAEDDLRVGPKPVPPQGVSQMLTEDDIGGTPAETMAVLQGYTRHSGDLKMVRGAVESLLEANLPKSMRGHSKVFNKIVEVENGFDAYRNDGAVQRTRIIDGKVYTKMDQ